MTAPIIHRRSFARACTAIALGGQRAPDILRANWRDDTNAERVLRAVTSPLDTSDFPAAQSTVVLPQLAPAAASSRLLALANSLDLTGINQIKLPYIAGAGRPASTPFVAEGAPAPVFDLTTSATELGPTRKILIQSAVSSEMQSASADTALALIEQALAASTEVSLDAALFSANAPTPEAPGGLLYGVMPIASAGTKGAEGAADDLGLLARAISANGINADDLVVVTTASLATKLKCLVSPNFSNQVMSSSAIPDGTVLGIVPKGLATGYSGAVQVEISNTVTVHYEDANPQPIVDGEAATPTLSAFQQNLLVIKVRAQAAWAVLPGAVAVVTGADW